MEAIRDFVRAQIPFIRSMPAYALLEEQARYRAAFADGGEREDEEGDAADAVLERLLPIIEEAGRRAGKHEAAARRSAAALLLEKLPPLTHHFSVMWLLNEMDARELDAAFDARAAAAALDAQWDDAVDDDVTDVGDGEAALVCDESVDGSADPFADADGGDLEGLLAGADRVADAFAIGERLHAGGPLSGRLDPDGFLAAWRRYRLVRTLDEPARVAMANRAREVLPVSPEVAQHLSDTHALMLRWQAEAGLLEGAAFRRVLAMIEFIEAHEGRLVSEGLARFVNRDALLEPALVGALAWAPYREDTANVIPGPTVFDLEGVVDDAHEIDEALRTGMA